MKRFFKTFSLRCYAALLNKDVTSSLRSWHKRYDLMPQIFDVTSNENARYKRNELEWLLLNDYNSWVKTAIRF